jgi:hypothetical protein
MFLAGLLTHFPQLQTLCLVLPYPPLGHSAGTDEERRRCERYREWLEEKFVEFWFVHDMSWWDDVQGLGVTADEIETASHGRCSRWLREGLRWERAVGIKWAKDVDGEVETEWGGERRELSELAKEYLRMREEKGPEWEL